MDQREMYSGCILGMTELKRSKDDWIHQQLMDADLIYINDNTELIFLIIGLVYIKEIFTIIKSKY